MNEFLDFLVENQMLIYAIICLILLILLCTMFPGKKKKVVVKEEKLDDVKTYEELTHEDIEEIVSDDTFIYEKIDFIEEEKTNELDRLLNVMQQDLVKQQVEMVEENLTESYEDEQEKTAIISYQELLQAARENKIRTNYDDEENAIMSTKKIDNNLVEIVEEVDSKKFKNSEFISPVFGKQEPNLDYPKVPNFHREEFNNVQEENTKNIDIDDTEVITFGNSEDEEFLKALKEFRNNLR